MSIEQPSIRDRARQAVRLEVQQEAFALFAEHGYEATTVDTIAAAAGMSRRTFFRYFDGKDDLVLARMVESGEEMAAELRAQRPGLPPWPALRAAFQVIVERQIANPDRSRRLQVMLRDEPSVRAALEEWRRRWTTLLRPVVAERMSASGHLEVRAEAVVRSALECLETAQDCWAREPAADLSALLDEAMGAVSALS